MKLDDLDKKTFVCFACKQEFEKGADDDEALEEMRQEFGDVPVDECDYICDSCYHEYFVDHGDDMSDSSNQNYLI